LDDGDEDKVSMTIVHQPGRTTNAPIIISTDKFGALGKKAEPQTTPKSDAPTEDDLLRSADGRIEPRKRATNDVSDVPTPVDESGSQARSQPATPPTPAQLFRKKSSVNTGCSKSRLSLASLSGVVWKARNWREGKSAQACEECGQWCSSAHPANFLIPTPV
jgi:hypothetical protein